MEIIRLSFTGAVRNVRYIVTQTPDGLYHVQQIIRTRAANRPFRMPIVESSNQKDIHGPMDAQAYIAWLQTLVFEGCHTRATPYERKWMLAID